jgi:Uma2 family endonuclease
MADLAAPPEPGLRMTRQEFRRWAETQSTGRFERIEGTVVAMAPERADQQ